MYNVLAWISRALEWLCNPREVQEEPSNDEHHNPPIPASSHNIAETVDGSADLDSGIRHGDKLDGSNPACRPRRQRRTKYDVFINHRGPDNKETFVSHLAEALKVKGYTVFVDQPALVKGEPVGEGIKSAIQDARVHLALFSSHYAESQYCLDELVDMLECVKKDPQGAVKLIPVFFDVAPSNLRVVDMGPFQKAFQHHADRGRDQRIPLWKKALREAAEMMGFERHNFRTESELKNGIVLRVEEIIDSVRVDRTQPVPPLNVGRQARLGIALEELGRMGDNVAILGICGMGGIGKTTLAMEIYNHYSSQRVFEYQTFLELGKGKGLVQLQKQALLELLDKKEENVTEKYRGYFNDLVGVTVLVVIDDISYAKHFTELVPDLNKLGAGSRIILTSRDKDVLNLVFDEAPLAYHLHEMKVLSPDESWELFCSHAFRNREIPIAKTSDGFRLLAEKVAGLCGGLPLALEIIGKHLRHKPQVVWEEATEIMRANPDVIDVLSISYKGLSSKADKMMFLDVSCHMVGLLKKDAIDIWKSCSLRACSPRCRPNRCLTSECVENSLENLISKSLVEEGKDERLTMHDLLQEMGRKMVGEELIDGKKRDLRQYSHLWNPADAEEVLNEEEGTKEVRGLSLVGLDSQSVFEASMFENMTEIHFLKLDGARIEGDFSLLSKKIRWMQWRSSFLTRLPSQLHYLNLAVLDLSNSVSLTRLWTDGDMVQVPRLLKVLIIQNCVALEEIPENIKSLTMLRTLDLQGCKNLKRLPSSLGELKALLDLNLNGCGSLESLPDGVVNLSNLKNFSMNGCVKISELPEDFGDLGALATFSAEGASSLTFLPDSFSRLSTLDTLLLSDCHSLSHLPKSVKGLTQLRVLRAHQSAVRELPSDFGDLKSLVELCLTQCNQLQSLPESFGDLLQLRVLNLEKSLSFRKLSNGFGKLRSLTYLNLEECPIEDSDLPLTFGGLEKLSTLNMQKNKMTKLPSSFRGLTALTHLNMQESPSLADVEMLPVFLEELELGDCPKVLGIYLEKLTKLRKLNLCNCTNLTKVEGLEHAKALKEINLSGCCSLSELQHDLLESTMADCFLSGSRVCLKFNNEWSQAGAPDSQLVSYYDHAIGFAENMMTKKIAYKEDANELCMEISTSRDKGVVQAVVITVVAHDQGWSDYIHLHGRYNANCDIEARIVRSDVEVFSSRIFALRHADYRDQVYICALRKSHPLVQRLKHDDKICVYARSRYLRWGITVMQGNVSVAYDTHDLSTKDPYENLLLKDNLSSSRVQSANAPRVLQALTRPVTIRDHSGVSSSRRLVIRPKIVQDLKTQLAFELIMAHPSRSCDVCGILISERGFHCNTCADFDMCHTCKTNPETPSLELQSDHQTDHPLIEFEVPPTNRNQPLVLPFDGNPNMNWGYVVCGFPHWYWTETFPLTYTLPCPSVND